MLPDFDTVCVKRGLEKLPEVGAFLDAHRDVPTVFFRATPDLQNPNGVLGGRRLHGRRYLLIDSGSASLLGNGNWDCGMGMCQLPLKVPSYTKAAIWSLYSFSQNDDRFQAARPFVLGYAANLGHYEKSLRKRYGRRAQAGTIIASHGFDILACDAFRYAPELVEMFGKVRNVKLVIITKAGMRDVQPLLAANHNGHTILCWSVACKEVTARGERNSVPLDERLDAAKAAQDAGYEVRFRVSFLQFAGWQDAYARTIDAIYAREIRPSRITLCSFPGIHNLYARTRMLYPQWDLFEQPLLSEHGNGHGYPRYVRMRFYRHAIAKIREHDDQAVIALCRESFEVHKALEGRVDRARCNCQP